VRAEDEGFPFGEAACESDRMKLRLRRATFERDHRPVARLVHAVVERQRLLTTRAAVL
jgi:hypothetical protein